MSSRTPPEIDDLTLRRAARGERSACVAFVRRYEVPVFAVLSRMVGPRRDLVEDLAQETFMKAFRALPRFRREGARASTWLLTIATRVAIDALRRERPQAGALEVVPGGERPDQAFEQRALGARIETAVEDLPPMQRAAFVLREYHGLSYDEIARCTETNVGTVRSRLNRARAALRLSLQEERA